jgi:uncharacterized membrane protein (UPF0127 family)
LRSTNPSLINGRSGQTIATAIELALTRSARRRGLLDRTALDPSSALMLAPCLMIHTGFMRFAIDVIFVNRSGRVLRIVRDLGPWRIAASFGAYATIELAAGALVSRDVAVGDCLYLDGAAGAGFTAGRVSSTLDSWRKTAASPARSGS